MPRTIFTISPLMQMKNGHAINSYGIPVENTRKLEAALSIHGFKVEKRRDSPEDHWTGRNLATPEVAVDHIENHATTNEIRKSFERLICDFNRKNGEIILFNFSSCQGGRVAYDTMARLTLATSLPNIAVLVDAPKLNEPHTELVNILCGRLAKAPYIITDPIGLKQMP